MEVSVWREQFRQKKGLVLHGHTQVEDQPEKEKEQTEPTADRDRPIPWEASFLGQRPNPTFNERNKTCHPTYDFIGKPRNEETQIHCHPGKGHGVAGHLDIPD